MTKKGKTERERERDLPNFHTASYYRRLSVIRSSNEIKGIGPRIIELPLDSDQGIISDIVRLLHIGGKRFRKPKEGGYPVVKGESKELESKLNKRNGNKIKEVQLE